MSRASDSATTEKGCATAACRDARRFASGFLASPHSHVDRSARDRILVNAMPKIANDQAIADRHSILLSDTHGAARTTRFQRAGTAGQFLASDAHPL